MTQKKCGTLDSNNNLVDTDMSGYSAEIQGVAAAVWTDAIKAKYKQRLIDDKGWHIKVHMYLPHASGVFLCLNRASK